MGNPVPVQATLNVDDPPRRTTGGAAVAVQPDGPGGSMVMCRKPSGPLPALFTP